LAVSFARAGVASGFAAAALTRFAGILGSISQGDIK